MDTEKPAEICGENSGWLTRKFSSVAGSQAHFRVRIRFGC